MQIENSTFFFEAGLALLSAVSGAGGAMAILRYRLAALEEQLKGLGATERKKGERLSRRLEILAHRVTRLEKGELTFESRIASEVRALEEYFDKRYVTVKEYSVTISDIRRHVERLESREGL